MEELNLEKKRDNVVEIATFHVGDALYGIDILNIQEINKNKSLTWVPQAPEYVLGVLNLRGRIVTIIDLGIKLGLSPIVENKKNRNIIVNCEDEYIGILVDGVNDVLITNADEIEKPPANIGGVQGKFFKGVLKTENSLVGLLNIEEVVKEEKA